LGSAFGSVWVLSGVSAGLLTKFSLFMLTRPCSGALVVVGEVGDVGLVGLVTVAVNFAPEPQPAVRIAKSSSAAVRATVRWTDAEFATVIEWP
jgi:hypothetical protein